MKIVFLDSAIINPGDISWEGIKGLGTFENYKRSTREEALERLQDADAAFTDSFPIDREIMEKCPKLKFIGIAATGFNHIDLEAAKELGIAVANVPAYAANAVAQHAMALLLALTNQVEVYNNAVGEGEWRQSKDYTFIKTPLTLLAGKSIGIVGYGDIGSKVAQMAEAFGMKVNIYSRDKEAAIKSDVVSLNCPLTKENAGMINAEFIGQMKDGAILINTARGGLVDEEALIDALESGKVKKYVTDFANPLVAGREGILVTPHLGASTEESEENCAEMAVKEIRDFLENGNIKNSVNFPNCDMGTCVAVGRISITHKNIPNMISQFTKILGDEGVNIADMTNKSKGEFAYTLIDLESAASKTALDALQAVDGVAKVRVIK